MRHLDLFSGYTISECGEVRNRYGRILKPYLSNAGYFRIELWANGRGRKYSVHRLVAKAFVKNPKGMPQVNHIDGDKRNNHYTNLEWTDQSSNQLHAYQNGLQKGYKKPAPLSDYHKAALCGSRWRGEHRIYHACGLEFSTPEAAASHLEVSRQTVYNRAKSPNFPDWAIEIRREVKTMPENRP